MKNKKIETINHNKKLKSEMSHRSKFNIEADMLGGEKMFYTIDQIKRFADEAREYIENNPRCLKMTQFVRHKNITWDTWLRWVEKYDWFAKNHRECLRALGDKREIGASFKELDKDIQLKVMHKYDPDWAEINQYHSDLKKKENESKSVPVVVFPDSETLLIKNNKDDKEHVE